MSKNRWLYVTNDKMFPDGCVPFAIRPTISVCQAWKQVHYLVGHRHYWRTNLPHVPFSHHRPPTIILLLHMCTYSMSVVFISVSMQRLRDWALHKIFQNRISYVSYAGHENHNIEIWHYLIHGWPIVSRNLNNIFQWNVNQNGKIIAR